MLERIEAWWDKKDKSAKKKLVFFGLFALIIAFAVLTSIFGKAD